MYKKTLNNQSLLTHTSPCSIYSFSIKSKFILLNYSFFSYNIQ